MTALQDFTSDSAKVRLLISDIDVSEQIFNDQAIGAFLSIASGNVKRAAASALLVIAVSEVLVQKRIKLLDLSTDGPAEAEALRKLADQYRKEADEADEIEGVDGLFDWADMILTPAQYEEQLYGGLVYEPG